VRSATLCMGTSASIAALWAHTTSVPLGRHGTATATCRGNSELASIGPQSPIESTTTPNNSGWLVTERHGHLQVKAKRVRVERGWPAAGPRGSAFLPKRLTVRPSRKPAISAKDRSSCAGVKRLGWRGSSRRREPGAGAANHDAGRAAAVALQVIVVSGRCLSRSASGPRPKRCTKSAPWRSRRPVGEAWSRASARWAACSSAQAATGAASVTSASWPARRLVVVRISCLRSLPTIGRHGRGPWLSQ
jgi:hypothetical protein